MLGVAGLIGQVCALGGWLLVWGISPRKGQWRPRVQEGLLHPPVLLPRLLPAGSHGSSCPSKSLQAAGLEGPIQVHLVQGEKSPDDPRDPSRDHPTSP